MTYRDFEYAFVHRFGSHGGEAPEEILERKQNEIDSNGWTLWSFQPRRMLEKWRDRLGNTGADVYAFCSWSDKAKDPDENEKNRTLDCTHYRAAGTAQWRRMPESVRSSYPFEIGSNAVPSAFIVRKIAYPVNFASTVEWLDREGQWVQRRNDKVKNLPSRGEYLMRYKRNGAPLRRIRAVLELESPYLAYLKVD